MRTVYGLVYLMVYVDEMLVASVSSDAVAQVKQLVQSLFKSRDLGPAQHFLGMVILRDRAARKLWLSQELFATSIVNQYGMQDARVRELPLSAAVKLTKDDGAPLDTQQHPYSQLVGSLLYLVVCTRPDLAYAVGMLARFMSAPRQPHWDAAMGVLKYLAGTLQLALSFGGDGDLMAYCDSDYAGCLDTRRSCTGYVFLLNSGAVSWSSRFQPTVAASTVEAEYMAASAAVKEALWFKSLLPVFGIAVSAVPLHCDNQGAIKLSKHPVASQRSKHIDVHHHIVRERVARQEVHLVYIPTTSQLADCFTKVLPVSKFQFCVSGIGMQVPA